MKKIGLTLLLLLALASPSAQAWYNTSLAGLGNRYKKVLKKFTHLDTIYSVDLMESHFKWYATYLSPEFREAFLESYEHYYPAHSSPAAEKFASQISPESNLTEFYIALYSKEAQLHRMTGGANLWEISLVVDGKTYLPIHVDEVPITPFHKRFFPYLVDRWYQTYRVTFSEVPAGEKTLRLNSAAGVSRLRF